jgi:uncharacterized protein YeaO (DUF488 family)
MADVRLKRIYDAAEADDGQRVLVERLWPRGVRKADARLDEWLKEVAPSQELRQWYAHDPDRWPEFRDRYRAELAERPELVADLRRRADPGPLTLVFAAKDRSRNSAVVLAEVIEAGA